LAPYWAGRLGRPELTGYQASARGGTVRVRVEGDRVLLAGRAVTVFSGQLSEAALPPLTATAVKGQRRSAYPCMPRAFAAAYSTPPDRATALTRPSDQGCRTVT